MTGGDELMNETTEHSFQLQFITIMQAVVHHYCQSLWQQLIINPS
jgi:hypothetical protein